MKTTLSRAKTLATHNMGTGNTLAYVRDVEILHPELALTGIIIGSIPKICLVPRSTEEKWVATGRKNVVEIVTAYLVLMYNQRESSIIGDATKPGNTGKGIVDFVEDFLTVFRGTRLSVSDLPYLDKPLDITNIDYADPIVTDNGHLIVSAITMECSRLIDQFTLPGNI